MQATILQTFQRVERKYWISPAQRAALLARLQPYIRPDVHPRYTIGSLYLDTADFRLIRASLDKPVYKEKLRLRSYGVPGPQAAVFLELKKKYKGVVYKRRLALPLDAANAYLWRGTMPETDGFIDGQILREIDWTMCRLRPRPRVYIAYDRTAFVGRADPAFRLTFDTAIRWRDAPLDLAAGDGGTPLLPDDRVLMEVKCSGAMPLWLCHALDDLKIYPAAFSKYGTCYTAHLRGGEHYTTGGIRYA